MSIICYTGLPGGGKSYSAVENVIIPSLKAGRVVAHNLTLVPAALSVVCGKDITSQLVEIDRDATPDEVVKACPAGAVIVIDEVWRYWPAGTTAREIPKDELKFFKEHRHRVGADNLASEICIIDQDPKTGVPAFLRSLIELTYIHTKHSTIGLSKSFRVDVYARAQSADKPSKSALIRKLQGRYKPEVWNCYQSHTQSTNIGEAGLEQQPDERANLLKSTPLRAAFACALALPFLFWLAWRSVSGMVDGGGLKQPPAVAVADFPSITPTPQPWPVPRQETLTVAQAENRTSELVEVAPTATPIPEPTRPPTSSRWRVMGGIQAKDGTAVVMLTSSGGRQRLSEQECSLDHQMQWTCQVEDGHATQWSGGAYSSMSAGRPEGMF